MFTVVTPADLQKNPSGQSKGQPPKATQQSGRTEARLGGAEQGVAVVGVRFDGAEVKIVVFPKVSVAGRVPVHSTFANMMGSQHMSDAATNSGRSLTESASEHRHLEHMGLAEILERMNGEDQKVPLAVAAALPQIQALAEAVLRGMKAGGRLFYLGAGTSGRLGVVDASECPPTFGVDFDKVIALIAGGDGAIRKAVEFAEDDEEAGWKDLEAYQPGPLDTVVGLAASGRTPYVLGALNACQQRGIPTGCVTCNPGAELLTCSDYPVVVAVGPEFLTGSTRLKSGTAQKLVLNMLTTSVMIGLGLVEDNKMTHLRPSNLKLQDRARRMIMEATGLGAEQADEYLRQYGQVHRAVEAYRQRPNQPSKD